MNKIAGIGCAAGIAAACIPSALGYAKSKNVSLFNEDSFLHCEGARILNAGNEEVSLCCIAPLEASPSTEMREAFFSRFGAYGEAQLSRVFSDSYFSLSDISNLAGAGFNCVELSFDRTMLFSSNIKGAPDFERLDSIIAHCKKNGIYVILNLHSVQCFDEKSKKKDKSAKILKKLWGCIAAHYSDEPAVAAFDIHCSSLFEAAHLAENEDALLEHYKCLNKVIRKKDKRHIIIIRRIFEENKTVYNIEDFGKYTAFSYDASYLSSLELSSKLRNVKFPDCPCFVLSACTSAEDLQSLSQRGLVPSFTGFKHADCARTLYSYSLNIDLVEDSYEEITKKLTDRLKTENCAKLSAITLPVEDARPKAVFTYSVGYRSGKKLTKISNQEGSYEN